MQKTQHIFQVALAINGSKSIFDYTCNHDLQLGQIVAVELRKKLYLGIIWSKNPSEVQFDKLKNITHIYENFSLTKEILKFLYTLSSYNLTPLGSLLKLYLPNERYFKVKPQESSNELYNFNLPKLNPEQEKAYKILKTTTGNGYQTTLFSGVTGSGKTEVYLHITKEVIERTKGQILILLPEIMLTNNMVYRFKERLGTKPLTWHSGIGTKAKKNIISKIASGKQAIIVGARSALFLPYKNLSLIIVDEEHDQSYKQEENVIYNARDAAVLLAKILNIPAILASATPSIESYYNGTKNKYVHCHLAIRHKEVELPEIFIEDLHTKKLMRGQYVSRNLLHKIAQEISKGKQALLFLNRKGFAPITICNNCSFTYKCSHCSTNLVYHQARNIYLCHYCGHSLKSSSHCPSCNMQDSLRYCGAGIEKVSEEVKQYFPDKNIDILSSDHLNKKNYQEIFDNINSGKTDIIIGTQIISKGYHFRNLSCVGVIDADLGFLDADLRSAEKNFQVINQVVGRAGREEKGIAIIQTYYPENKMLQSLQKGDYQNFYKYELSLRNIAALPPFKRLIAIIISSANKPAINKFLKKLTQERLYSQNIEIMGPIEAPIYKLKGRFRYRFLLKSDIKINLQQYVREWLKNVAVPSNIRLKIDVDPYNFL